MILKVKLKVTDFHHSTTREPFTLDTWFVLDTDKKSYMDFHMEISAWMLDDLERSNSVTAFYSFISLKLFSLGA